ncbi:helix-hairpin-helix domain-containing protein [Desulfohalobium retbaense]|uniref:Tex-like protein protein-like protein n=1 Tax=Desulfohalobium retbaense (strain ATCC 49708 / DSM 5692 / JCM 16813 / HR100) TaxID=485915 RepID=C8X033_DESRD|nr:Tex family protein [Desulfohalobium retbaense]ACV67658.1 Tex-like protein protein-like protein [Desulfohalobium retbaense DSM 5692]
MDALHTYLVEKTGIPAKAVGNILALFESGATIPFIARYRKDQTGGVEEEQLRAFEEAYRSAERLLERKAAVLRLIEERGHLTDAIRAKVDGAQSLTEVEDIYRPYKEKKSTRAGRALAQGLGPLADVLQQAALSEAAFRDKARAYVGGEVADVDQAVQGAQDILAERLSDDPREREVLRNQVRRHGVLEVKPGKAFDTQGVYAGYGDYREKLAGVVSHRYLAIMRGVRDKQLRVAIRVDLERTLANILRSKIPKRATSVAELLRAAYQDGLKRLLFPAVEREMHAELKERADRQAVAVFGANLRQMLMTPPVSGQVLMGVDPAYRTGCKLAVIDPNGKLLETGVIFPTPPQNDVSGAAATVRELVRRHQVQGVAIGNGTASRETQEFFAGLNRDQGLGLKYTVVSEAGASVYSASKLAQAEYPDLDVTLRGAISIAQRLRDPMAELVKIDPKSLGIGQYQHDVDQKLLARKLHETIEDLVNQVGVEVNSASAALLGYVAGLGPKLARGIVADRETKGPFGGKKDLLRVAGLGPKAFEQCAGFLRIRQGRDLLDNTGVHPESYGAATRLREEYDPHVLSVQDCGPIAAKLGVGRQTLTDIVFELQKPGFDPRQTLPAVPFRDDVRDIEALREGDIVSGVVRSIVDFGAFVDVGLKNDGLIHISELSHSRVSHPLEVLAVNQYLPRIRVLRVFPEKGQVALSLKE